MSKLVTIKTLASPEMADALSRLARSNERTIAAETRIAIGVHLTKHAPSKKDGAK